MKKIKHINKDDKTNELWMSVHIHMAQKSGYSSVYTHSGKLY
jgi:hypothetical protein